MKLGVLTVLAGALFVTSAGSVLAQDEAADPVNAQDSKQMGRGQNMPAFADFDLNDDGSIASDEFYKARGERIAKRAKEGRQMKNLANAPSFEDIDTDKDGAISPEEFSAHQAEHMQQAH